MTEQLNRYDVKKVVCILAGSRTGSGALFRELARSGDFLAPSGEETPFYRKVGIGIFSGSHFSDEILKPPPETQLDEIGRALLEDTGVKMSVVAQPKEFAETIIARLKLQWPQAFTSGSLVDVRELLMEKLVDRKGKQEDWTRFNLAFTSLLKGRGFKVDESLYSTDSLLHVESLPHPLLEDLPYIISEPRQKVTRTLLERSPLLLKTNANIYRIPMIKALFPKASFRWILLSRNPQDTINALMDGWLSGGFYSHKTSPDVPLQIYGYSDQVPGGRDYWKFEMPPGWQRYAQKDLIEVCSFQWESAHRQLLKFMKNNQEPMTCVRYEDLDGEEIGALIEFAEGHDQSCSASSNFKISDPPAHWKDREQKLKNVLFQSKTLLATAAEFDYLP